eukprot:4893037-Prymnesium_polylepis.1
MSVMRTAALSRRPSRYRRRRQRTRARDPTSRRGAAAETNRGCAGQSTTSLRWQASSCRGQNKRRVFTAFIFVL